MQYFLKIKINAKNNAQNIKILNKDRIGITEVSFSLRLLYGLAWARTLQHTSPSGAASDPPPATASVGAALCPQRS